MPQTRGLARPGSAGSRPPQTRLPGSSLPPLRHLRPASRLPGRAGRGSGRHASITPASSASSRAQQERARQSSKMGTVKGDPVYMKLAEEGGKTDFLGYAGLSVEDARVLAVLKDGALASRLDAGEEGLVVLDRTPFYAMSGGQVGDRGVIASDGSAAEVTDTTAPLPGLSVHQVRVTHGGFERGMVVRAEVDARASRRRDAPPHGHAPAPRGPARDPRPARQAGGEPRGARPPPLRLQPLRAGRPARAAPRREPGERGDPAGRPRSSRRSWVGRRPWPTGRSRSSATSTASASAWSRSPASRRSSAAARTSARPGRSASSWSPPSRASRPAPGGSRPSPARRPSSGPRATRGFSRSSSRRRGWTVASWSTSTPGCAIS